MTAFLADWLNLLLRWAHIIVGISWMVHGGGFYHVEKYLVAPAALPDDLHWFKWEAYLTWITGMFLLAVQYYLNADAYLIDPSVMPLTTGGAIGISLLTLAGGWLIYDLLCRSPIGRHTGLLGACVFVLIVG